MSLKSGKRQIGGNRNLEAIEQRESVGKFGRRESDSEKVNFSGNPGNSIEEAKKPENPENTEMIGKQQKTWETRETRNSQERTKAEEKICESPKETGKQQKTEKVRNFARG